MGCHVLVVIGGASWLPFGIVVPVLGSKMCRSYTRALTQFEITRIRIFKTMLLHRIFHLFIFGKKGPTGTWRHN